MRICYVENVAEIWSDSLMSKRPDTIVELSDTLSLCEYETGGSKGFWLYDETRGMNLAMRSKTERSAFLEALEYYQDRLSKVETEYKELRIKVNTFIEQFSEED